MHLDKFDSCPFKIIIPWEPNDVQVKKKNYVGIFFQELEDKLYACL
jgi:hypothetical protein